MHSCVKHEKSKTLHNLGTRVNLIEFAILYSLFVLFFITKDSTFSSNLNRPRDKKKNLFHIRTWKIKIRLSVQ